MVIKSVPCKPFAEMFSDKNRREAEGGRVRW